MSKNPDEYHVPVPQGSEPEQQPPSENRRWLWIAVTFLFIGSLLAAAAIFWLRSEDEPIQTIVGDESSAVETTTITRVGQNESEVDGGGSAIETTTATSVSQNDSEIDDESSAVNTTAATPVSQSESETDDEDFAVKKTTATRVGQSESKTDDESPAVETTTPTRVSQSESEALNRIVFVDSESRLVTVNPDGSERRLLTELGLLFQFPAWSPIDDSIAAIRNDLNGAGVYVIPDRPDEQLQQLYNGIDYSSIYLFWSPDGEQVSFIAEDPDGMALHLAPTDGIRNSQILASGQGSIFWNWLPDSSQVLIHTGFTATARDMTRLAFIPVDEGDELEVQQEGFFQAPGVAADGQRFSFSDSDPFGNQWLNVWKTASRQQDKLIQHNGVVAMGWSPASDQLAYIGPTEPAPSFYGPLSLLNLESGKTEELTSEIVLAFFWSPDGRSIAYITLDSIVEPGEEQPASGSNRPEPQRIIARNNTISNTGVDLSHPLQQNSRIILLNLWVIDLDSLQPRLLYTFEPSDVFLSQFMPFFDQYALSHSLWSPDNKAIVIPAIDEAGLEQIVVIPVDGNEPLAIGEGEVAFWSHR